MTKDVIKDIAVEGAKASPPVAILAASATQGWTLSHALTAITILYVLLQIGWLVWRWRKAAQGAPIGAE